MSTERLSPIALMFSKVLLYQSMMMTMMMMIMMVMMVILIILMT
jgi:hypothetical protein